MPERILTTRELNRAMLARQLLLERAALPITRALERVAGLQTQYAPSGYVGLWSRIRNLDRAALTRALEQRRVIQATLMRTTIHMVSPADFWLFVASSRQEWFLKIPQYRAARPHLERAAALIRKRLASGPTRATELRRLLDEHHIPPITWAGLGHWLDMVRVPPSGTWTQRRADLYGLADSWVGARPTTATEERGLEHLVQRYLGAFGPAMVKEIANWAGVAVPRIQAAVERLSLRHFGDERGSRLVDLPNAPLPKASTPAPVRFLPTWDAILLVHARRTQVLPEAYRPRVFSTKTPHSAPTFLIDGAVAGTWRYERGRVRIDPFDSIPPAVRGELDAEARALASFHAD